MKRGLLRRLCPLARAQSELRSLASEEVNPHSPDCKNYFFLAAFFFAFFFALAMINLHMSS
jgi:hypothetical protein